jgi:hypothetical protein
MHFCTSLKQTRKALDDRSEECISIGHACGKMYRVLRKTTRKLTTRRDVKFDETLLRFGTIRNKADVETCSDSDFSKQPFEASERILVSVSGLLSLFHGAAAKSQIVVQVWFSRRCCMECLIRPSLFHLRTVFQDHSEMNELKTIPNPYFFKRKTHAKGKL